MSSRRRFGVFALCVSGWLASGSNAQPSARQGQPAPTPPNAPSLQAVLDAYCIGCHNQRLRTAGLALDGLDVTRPADAPELWERVIAKLRSGAMPPPGRPRPDAATYRAMAAALEDAIDREWLRHPPAARISAVHRLNRTEYNHAIRDLFAFDAASVDVTPL